MKRPANTMSLFHSSSAFSQSQEIAVSILLENLNQEQVRFAADSNFSSSGRIRRDLLADIYKYTLLM
jgi:hypothetical protein